MEHAYLLVKPATATLERLPTDAEANLIVGKYECFYKGDWQHGLPMLALGGDPTLESLGEQEVAGVASSMEQARLGDSWWNAAEIRKGIEKKQMAARAACWYRRALPGLTGLLKDKAISRIQKVGASDPVYLADLQAEEVRVMEVNNPVQEKLSFGGRFSNRNL